MGWTLLEVVVTVVAVIAFIDNLNPVFSTPTTSQPCASGQYACNSGQCIALSLVCNARPDCSDGSDEAKCLFPCSFELNTCGWHEEKIDKFDWLRASGAQTAANRQMAPPIDATRQTQNGFFVYVNDSTGGQTQGLSARFVSPPMSARNQQCKIEFSYLLNRQNIGTLNLFSQTNGSQPVQLWSRFGMTGGSWQSVIVGVGQRLSSFTLYFERVPDTDTGQSAIDDIRFLDCSFPAPQTSCDNGTQFTCNNKACVQKYQVCDLTNDCGDNSDEAACGDYVQTTFENGLGDLLQGVNGVDDDLDWSISFITTVDRTGPKFDHTTGTPQGKYLYIDASQQLYPLRRWLMTRPIQSTQGKSCRLRFYLFIYGPTINTVNIYYSYFGNGPPTQLVLTLTREQGPYWQRIDQALNVNQPFRIIIEGITGNQDVGGIAIDDVSLTPGCVYATGTQLPTQPTTQRPPRTTPTTVKINCTSLQFTCSQDKSCIDKNRVCDFRSDCSDFSDEKGCVEQSCGFDDMKMCGWMVSTNNRHTTKGHTFNWELVQGITATKNGYRPQNDRTQNTPQGWYAFADSSSGSFHDTTEFYTPTISRTGPQCKVVFNYFIDGPSVDSIHVLLNMNGAIIQLWEIDGRRGKIWRESTVFIGAKTYAVVAIQARRGTTFEGGISVDNLHFVDCPPPKVTPTSCLSNQFQCANKYCIDSTLQCNYADDCGDGSDEPARQCAYNYPGRCDFSHGICDFWSNDEGNDQFDWSLAKGSTPTLGTGPSTDHTTRSQSGGYLYTDGSPPRKRFDVARLSSRTILGSSKNCFLRLWYHMWGKEIGYLTVLKRFSNVDYTGLTSVDTFQGDHGDAWIYHSYSLTNRDTRNFKVVIQGDIGAGIHSNLAIDDLSLSPGCEVGGSLAGIPTPWPTQPGVCGQGQFSCQSGSGCYMDRDMCDFLSACDDKTDELMCGTSCDFEQNTTCGWKNSIKDNTNWVVQSGAGQEAGPGPSTDHTLHNGNGHYLLGANRPFSKTGDLAILESSIYWESSASCQVSIWYNMFGSQGAKLSLHLKMIHDQVITLWTVTANSSLSWEHAQIPVGSFHRFSLVIEANFLPGSAGIIAIDDINFLTCAPTAEVASCPINQFKCANKEQCIPRERLCDHATDCKDGSDEDGCKASLGDCNFDNPQWLSLCQWTQRQNDDADWLTASDRVNPGTGPDADHMGSLGGYFLYVDSNQMRYGDVASIASPMFPGSRSVCYVRFFYYMYGSQNIGPLRVYTLNNDVGQEVIWPYETNYGKNLMWSQSGNQGQKWNYANVLVGDTNNFTVLFEATRGDAMTSDIAIDDVTFTPECATGAAYTVATGLVCDAQKEFACKPRNKCLPKSWICDGTWDCKTGNTSIDEPDSCPHSTTTTQSTQSTPTQTFPPTQSTPSTHKHSTQSTPPPKTLPTTTKPVTRHIGQGCPGGQFKCATGPCIPGIIVCDGVADCADNSDEILCPKCKPGRFYCHHKRLCSITNATRCNGVDDCGDKSDESLCSSYTCPTAYCQQGSTCLPNVRPLTCSCPTGYTGNRCQYAAKQAPETAQPASKGSLPSGQTFPPTQSTPSTHKHSTQSTPPPKTLPTTTNPVTRHIGQGCPGGQFKCATGQCIPGIMVCDGVADCADNSDEILCPQCKPGRFYCHHKRLCSITNATRCNGVDDCGDNSDESLCSSSTCPTSYCQQGSNCLPNVRPPACSCPTGYTGNRCQYAAKQVPEVAQPTSKGSGWKIGVGVTFGIVGAVVIAVVVFFLIRKGKVNLFTYRRHGPDGEGFSDYGTDSTEGNEENGRSAATGHRPSFPLKKLSSPPIENPVFSES